MTAAAILGCAPALIAYAVFNGTVAVIVWAVIFVAATLYWASKQERR